MDTETKAQSKLAPLRTYAKDLETGRTRKVNPPTSKVVTAAVDEVPPEPVRATDTLTAEITKVTPTVVTKPLPKKIPTVPALKPLAPTKKDPTILVENEDAASATIITDTKRGEFKLFPAIFKSIRGWFSEKKQDYVAKKIPKYVVPDTTRRKGIIQKATSQSGKFAASDFSSIQERILERKAAAAKATEVEEGPSTIWTANTEPGFPLLPQTTTEPQISNVQILPRKSFRAAPEEIVVTKAGSEKIEVEVSEPADDRWSAPKREVAPEQNVPAVIAKEEIAPNIETPEAEIIEVAEVEAEVPPSITPEIIEVSPTTPPQKTGRFDILKVNTNALTVFASGFVVLLAVLGMTLYFTLYKDGVAIPNKSVPETLLIDTEIQPLLLYSVTKETIAEAFTSLQDDRGTTEGVLMYTSTIGSTDTLSSGDILTALGISLAPDFAETISAVRIGYINQAPYILLKVKNETAAQGGLLIWEKTMYPDLTSLLYLANEDTVAFLDATISGTDVRVQKNTSGSERLLYGIVSGNIVITTNSASYAQLTAQLK